MKQDHHVLLHRDVPGRSSSSLCFTAELESLLRLYAQTLLVCTED